MEVSFYLDDARTVQALSGLRAFLIGQGTGRNSAAWLEGMSYSSVVLASASL